jgi:hypothetical protein
VRCHLADEQGAKCDMIDMLDNLLLQQLQACVGNA